MTATGTTTRMVVGVDGSPHSRAALVWAVLEAARRSASLEVVATFPVDFYWADAYLLDPRHMTQIREDTENRTRAFVDEVLSSAEVTGAAVAADVPVRITVAAGTPAEHLVQLSKGAALLVLGSRGRGGVRSTLLGSVALQCSAHAPCPVVVVRPGTGPGDGRVVVGFDDSAAGRAALQRAAEEARRRGGPLEVVVARVPVDTWSDLTVVTGPTVSELLEDGRRSAEQAVQEVLGASPDVEVRVRADVGPADDVLVRAAEHADLLVVGSRSRSSLAGMLLGSVALRAVVHAECPVMVVHPPAEEGAEPLRAATAGQA
ncbi:universal stress protein [Blastococcus sp. TF02A-30]|uniref:universal stress protein n=1 Tax=Blastococcus sp. TF02A-30 TaxID=2250580 RepID=UPI000DEA3DD1|nr:universal stress protein [Blastococcus sp. TF02A-30]RBY87738.1 universal stress protein [Blastococcus sp. TF02A-30]